MIDVVIKTFMGLSFLMLFVSFILVQSSGITLSLALTGFMIAIPMLYISVIASIVVRFVRWLGRRKNK